MHDHRGDYGIDGSFKTISARGLAIGIAAQSA
ncbi:SAM-dependent methyltransferase, partial [Mycobacterium interjectum]|nr:SAM-dependent methyltransferase [Mycobacterium interjectum]